MASRFYNSNQQLKSVGVPVEFTDDQLDEYIKCKQDPIYFIRNYVKIVSLDRGIVDFDLYSYQEKFVRALHENRMVIGMMPRQSGKTICLAAYIVWYLTFNDAKTVAILANKAAAAREIMARIQLIYENLPVWVQQGVTEWNKGSLTLENNSKAFTSATSSSGIRGRSVNLLAIDETAIIPNTVAEAFFTATYPTISSGQTTKIILTSTPLGLNHFWKFWTDAESGINGFIPIRVNYWEHPDRNENWANEQRKLLGELKFNQEVLCLGGKSIVTIKFKNNTIKNVTLEELSVILNGSSIENEIGVLHNDDGIQILTERGFSPFVGLRKSLCENPLRLTFSHKEIIASRNHVFIHKKRQVIVGNLQIGDNINGFRLREINDAESQFVYDPIQVFDGNEYIADGIVSHNCTFLGSSATLINSDALQKFAIKQPILSNDGLDVYYRPERNRSYILIADTAKGVGRDYSAFQVVDISELPYKLVAKYRDNLISPMLYPNVIYRVAKEYNEAMVLVEINSSEQVAHILYHDLEYENLMFVARGKSGQELSLGFGGTNTKLGITTDKKVKRLGCQSIKTLIENNQILIHDADTVAEFSTFIERNGTFSADDGKHDDLVMPLVLFGWVTTNSYFKDLSNINLRESMFKARMDAIENELLPIGFYSDGTVESDGWIPVS